MDLEQLKHAVAAGIAPFALTTYHNRERAFGIKIDDRRRHVYVIGKTGMGKTTLIENMVYSDIIAGHGVCYVDPHGDTAEKMLGWIPKERINDVIYFNPADMNFPISFNVLEKVAPEYRHLVSAGLIGVFKKQWADSWGPRLEYILRNAILALLEYPDSTLLGINRMLVDKAYNKKVVSKITDPVVRSFWVDEYPKWNERVLQEVISPIQNKVGQFLSTALIRNIVGQVKSSINLRQVMDNGKILILNLSKGRIGEDASALLGAMMVTKIQLAAMSRVDITEDDRRDFYLYVDEFQNFATDSFADILSEARKYRLNLIIAHQYIEQLGEVVQPAVFGNVGTIICFRVGAADAEFLEKEFMPNLTQQDLVNLPKFHVYLKLMIDGVASEPFSAKGLPPVYGDSLGNEEKVINVSRERYAKPKESVEDKIKRWSEPIIARDKDGITIDLSGKGKGGQAGGAKSDSKLYDANCYNCNVAVQVPFAPDGVRPIFCKDCLKKARRGDIKMPSVSKTPPKIQPPENVKSDVSLNQLNKQTVDFKGRDSNKSSQAAVKAKQPKPQPTVKPDQVKPQPLSPSQSFRPPVPQIPVAEVSGERRQKALAQAKAKKEAVKSFAKPEKDQVKAGQPSVAAEFMSDYSAAEKKAAPKPQTSQPEIKEPVPDDIPDFQSVGQDFMASQPGSYNPVKEGDVVEL